MLHVLEPWLVALAQQRAAEALEPQTASTAAALVFVFALAQGALVLGAAVMAFSFRLPNFGRANPASASAAGARTEASAAFPPPSRAEQLAYDLRRDQAQAVARDRTLQVASAAAPSTRGRTAEFSPTPRLGDAYRRPAITPRRSGAAR